jgi:hypothetical protein
MAVGVFALYKEAYPDKTNHEVLQLLKDNAMKLDGRTAWDMYYGYGLLQPSADILAKPRKLRDRGLKFFGTGERIESGNAASLDLTNNFTIMLDFSQDYANDGYLIAKNDPTKPSEGAFYGIRLGHDSTPGNRIYVYYITGGTFKSESFPISLSNTERFKLVVVYTYPNVLVYVNGKLKATLALSGNLASSTTSSGTPKLNIGSSGIAGERSFAGILYGTKMYSRVLSATEILNDYNKQDIGSTNLVLNYSLNGSETATVTDLSGSGNNGTLYGTVSDVKASSVTAFVSNLFDSVQLTESLTTRKTSASGQAFSKVLADSISLGDSISTVGVAPHTLTFSEVIVSSDTLIKVKTKALSDSISGNDTVVKSKPKSLTDSVGTGDSVSIAGVAQHALTFSETVTSSDTVVKAGVRGVSDSIGTSDSITKNRIKSVQDTVTALDSVAKKKLRSLSESVVSNDSITTATNHNVHSIVLTDFIATTDTTYVPIYLCRRCYTKQ